MDKNLDRVFLNAAFSLLLGIFTVFTLSFLGFIFGISINPIYPILGLLTTFCTFTARLYVEKTRPAKIIFYIVLLFATILGLICLSGFLMDPSYDGRGYHQVTAILLEKGWNPICNDIYAFCKANFNTETYSLIWGENYVKFSEIFAANIFALTGKIETGKAFNGLSALTAFCYGFYVLSKPAFCTQKEFKPKTRAVFAFLLVYNPIVLAQFFTYYIDGLLYLYFLIAVLALIDWKTELEADKKATVAMLFFIMASAVMLNIKLGGFLCFVSILLCALLFLALGRFCPFFKEARPFDTKSFWSSVIAVIILTLLSGINPYFTNISKEKHPLYPLFGKEKIDIMTPNTPKAFENKPIAYKFIISLFGKMDNFTNDSEKKPALKIPFSLAKTEFSHLDDPDTRISGFGVFFSGIFLMALALLFLPNYKNLQAKKEFTIIFATLGLATILNPESWWARYIPQLWAIVVFAGIFAYLNLPAENSPKKHSSLWFIRIFLLILFVNSFLINAASTAWARKYTTRTNKFINEIKTLQNLDSTAILRKIPEHPGTEFSYLQKLREAGVKYDIQKWPN